MHSIIKYAQGMKIFEDLTLRGASNFTRDQKSWSPHGTQATQRLGHPMGPKQLKDLVTLRSSSNQLNKHKVSSFEDSDASHGLHRLIKN